MGSSAPSSGLAPRPRPRPRPRPTRSPASALPASAPRPRPNPPAADAGGPLATPPPRAGVGAPPRPAPPPRPPLVGVAAGGCKIPALPLPQAPAAFTGGITTAGAGIAPAVVAPPAPPGAEAAAGEPGRPPILSFGPVLASPPDTATGTLALGCGKTGLDAISTLGAGGLPASLPLLVAGDLAETAVALARLSPRALVVSHSPSSPSSA